MRWFVGALGALVLLWLWFVASPYLAIWSLASAVERGDAAALAERVNLSALRISIARQLAADEIKAAGIPTQSMSSTDQQLAAGALALLADPVIERLLTRDGILRALGQLLVAPNGAPGPERAPRASSVTGARLAEIGDLIGASRWRGFRNVYVALPPNAPPERRVRLQLRLSRLSWRLVSADLPAAYRERIARDFAARLRAPP